MNTQLRRLFPGFLVLGLLALPGPSALGQTYPDTITLMTPLSDFSYNGGSQQLVSGNVYGNTAVATVQASLQGRGGNTTNYGQAYVQYTGGYWIITLQVSNPGVNPSGFPNQVSVPSPSTRWTATATLWRSRRCLVVLLETNSNRAG